MDKDQEQIQDMKFFNQMGKKAKDRVSGFEGIVDGICFYRSLTTQILLTPKVSKDGEHRDARWFSWKDIIVN